MFFEPFILRVKFQFRIILPLFHAGMKPYCSVLELDFTSKVCRKRTGTKIRVQIWKTLSQKLMGFAIITITPYHAFRFHIFFFQTFRLDFFRYLEGIITGLHACNAHERPSCIFSFPIILKSLFCSFPVFFIPHSNFLPLSIFNKLPFIILFCLQVLHCYEFIISWAYPARLSDIRQSLNYIGIYQNVTFRSPCWSLLCGIPRETYPVPF